MAGIEVVASYERWEPANETNWRNGHHPAFTADIRSLKAAELPKNIDIVVGSPPCTQFSYSNRGGRGDIDDGLTDIAKFFEIVSAVRPIAWAMENVPRTENIIRQQFEPGGRLHQYRDLRPNFYMAHMEEFGLPQRRKRCIVTNVDLALLDSYKRLCRPINLGQVITALASDPVVDPIYGLELPRRDLTDHQIEDVLDPEEERINHAAKQLHPVYNRMAFPDPMDRSVRTVTATCTRVSRESVVISAPETRGKYRRLSIRERACLQGFPINFQFFGTSYGQRLKMVGNALPPLFSYYVANAMKGMSADEVRRPSDAIGAFKGTEARPAIRKPDRPAKTYRADRRFKFAIPSLRLGSGVRFELHNAVAGVVGRWGVDFVFGDPKNIQTLLLDQTLLQRAMAGLVGGAAADMGRIKAAILRYLHGVDVENLQQVWSHRGPGRTRPFMMLDAIDDFGDEARTVLSREPSACRQIVAACIASQAARFSKPVVGFDRLNREAPIVLAGIIVGAAANSCLLKAVGLTDSLSGAAVSQS